MISVVAKKTCSSPASYTDSSSASYAGSRNGGSNAEVKEIDASLVKVSPFISRTTLGAFVSRVQSNVRALVEWVVCYARMFSRSIRFRLCKIP